MGIRRCLVVAAVALVALAPLSGQASARSQTVTIEVAVTGAGKVTGPGIDCGLGATQCATTIAGATAFTFDATPGENSIFAAWVGHCSGTNPKCLLVIPDDTDVFVRAVFGWVEVIDVQTAGSGEGRVVSNPAGIDCGEKCAKAFTQDTPVTLTAMPKQGSKFAGWSGWCTGTSTQCTLRATGTAYAIARFESVSGPSGGSKGGSNGNSSSSSAGGIVFTSLGWDVQNPDGTRLIAVQFRTSHAGTVWVKVKRGQKVWSAWHVAVRPGAVTIKMPMPAAAPAGPYRVYATIATSSGKKSLTWDVRL
jgi:hypothetical protein